jgi:hypothetical protein
MSALLTLHLLPEVQIHQKTRKLFQTSATTTDCELRTRWSSAVKTMMSNSTLYRQCSVLSSLIPRRLDDSPKLSFILRARRSCAHQPAQILVCMDKTLLHWAGTKSSATSDKPILQLSGRRDQNRPRVLPKGPTKNMDKTIPFGLFRSILETRSRAPLLLRMLIPEATRPFLACPSRHLIEASTIRFDGRRQHL